MLDTWTFLLEELDSEQTRLIMRLLGRLSPFWRLILEPGESVMTRQRLLGIKQQVEELYTASEAGGREFKLDQTGQAI